MSINLGAMDVGVAFVGDASGLQKSAADAQQGVEKFGASSAKAMRQVAQETAAAEEAWSRLATGMKSAAIGSSVAVGLIKLKNSIAEVSSALIDAQVQLDKWNNGFKFGAGSFQAGAQEMAFVRQEAQRLGLELSGSATQYMKLVAASRGSAMEGQKTREVFKAIAEAVTVMGMSGEQSERAFTAITQMMSKGKVQAEELRGQLGEHLPGAFGIAARAMGVTEAEMNKLLETGQVMSADFLPKFGAQLRKELAGSVEDASKSMQASLNRFETAWLSLKQGVASSGVSEAMGGQINILADAMANISERMAVAKAKGGGFWSQMASGAAGVAQFVNPLNALAYSALSTGERIKEAEKNLEDLRAASSKQSMNLMLRDSVVAAEAYVKELKKAKQAQDELLGGVKNNRDQTGYPTRTQSIAGYDKSLLDQAQAQGKAYADLMKGLLTPQEQFSGAVAEAKKNLGDLFTPEVEARMRAHYIKPAKEVKDKTDEFAKALESVQEKTSGLNTNYTETLTTLFKGFEAGKFGKGDTGLESYRAAVEALIKLQPFYKDGLRDQAKAQEDARKAAAAYASDLDRVALSDAKVLEMANAYIDTVDEQIKLVQFEASLMGETAVARETALKQYRIQLELEKQILAIKKEMASEDEQASAIARVTAAANKAKANAAAEVVNEEFKRVSQQIEQSLTDALMRGFENGKGFAQNLRDTIGNLFKTLVLKPVIQAVVSPVAGSITSAMGLSGSGGATGGITSLSGLGSAMRGDYSQAYSQFATSSFGQQLGLATPTGYTTGSGTTYGLSQSGAEVGKFVQQAGDFLGYASAVMTATSRDAQGGKDYGAGIGQAIGYAVGGPIGASIGNAIGSAIGLKDYGGTPHTGGSAQYSAATGVQTSVKENAFGAGEWGVDFGKAGTDLAKGFAVGTATMLDSVATTFGKKAGYTVATAFADDISPDGAVGALLVKDASGATVAGWGGQSKTFSDGTAGATEYAAAVAKDVRDYLITQTPDWADAALNALGDSVTIDQLAATVAQINATGLALTGMGRASMAFAGMSEEVSSRLVTALGGVTAAGANMADYYANFYSDSERTAIATQQLSEKMTALGVAMPDTREGFRALVDAAIAGGNPELAAALIKLQGSFAELVPAAEDASAAVAKSAAAMAKSYMAVLDANAQRYLSKSEYSDYAYTRASARLADLGLNFSKETLAATDAASIKLYVQQLAQAGGIPASTLSAIIEVTNDLLGIKESEAEAVARAAQQATDDAAKASTEYQRALEEAQSFIGGISSSISDFLARFDEQAGGIESYTRAWAAFQTQMTLASGGDRDALSGITSSAGALVEAIRRESSSAAEASLRIGRVRGQLAGLPGQLSPEQFIVDNLSAVITTGTGSTVAAVATGSGATAAAVSAGSGATVSAVNTSSSTISSALSLNAAQVSAAVTTGFSSFDTNSDGLLTIDEFRAGMAGKATDSELTYWFDQLDKNDDGTISQLELIASKTGSSIGFDPNDPIHSVWEAIKSSTSISAFYLQDSSNKLNAIQYYLGEPFRGTGSLKIRGETQAFAMGGVFTNSVVSGPTLFNMGLMGEAGPEAIMPLTRGPDGKLGVVAQVQMPDWSQYGRSGGSGGNTEVLVAEIRALRKDNQAQARALVQLQQRMLKITERWDGNGLPETRVVA